jgi:hypothetical protein
MSDEHCLIAENIMFLGDGQTHRAPGYTKVASLGSQIDRIYDFQRDLDQKQFVMVNHGGQIGWIPAIGGAESVLASGETAPFAFAKNVFVAYASNGIKSYRFVDKGGTLTKYKWGIDAPATAPAISLVSGSLSLVHGRQYVRCYVSKYTDSTGVERMHIGAPSPISAHTGPTTNKTVQLSSLDPSPDPQVTHQWIFGTADTPEDTTSAYYFAAEIGNTTSSWGDTLADSQLDTTQQAPFENFPAPAAELLVEYQSRIVAGRIAGAPNLVQLSAFEEVDLGIPQEAWPPSLAFPIPGGAQEVSGMCVFNEALMIGTPDFWFRVRGSSAADFQKQDSFIAPGPVGPKAVCVTPTHMVWVGNDKKVYAWDGAGLPVEISADIRKPTSANSSVFSMQDLDDSQLANCEVRWYSRGQYSTVVVLGSTQNSDVFDWIQLWDANSIGQQLSDGSINLLAETDFFPTHNMTASGLVEQSNAKYLFVGDDNGNLYRWPDGYTHDGTAVANQFGHIWTDFSLPEVRKRFFFLDFYTNRNDAADAWQVYALASDGPQSSAALIQLDVKPLPSSHGVDPTAARALLTVPKCSIGRVLRVLFVGPQDAADASILRYSVSFKPLSQVSAQ